MRTNENKRNRLVMLLCAITALHCWMAAAQPALPPPPPPNTNRPPPYTNVYIPPIIPLSAMLASGAETVLIDTMPAAPDSTHVLPSWETIHSGGLTIDTNGFIVDTNPTPSMLDGMPAGNAVGVVIGGGTNSPFVVTRGEFYVLLANDTGQLANTSLTVTISRNTNIFTGFFNEPMAEADYQTNDTNVILTPVAGTTNLYDLMVTFPPCVVGASRVVSIRTQPLDFDMPFAQLQWLVGDGDTNAVPAYQTDQTSTNLVQLSVVPAMRLWTEQVTGVGSFVFMNQTPNMANVLGLPGTVLQNATNVTDAYQDFFLPDSCFGAGEFDVTQNPSQFFKRRVDTSN